MPIIRSSRSLLVAASLSGVLLSPSLALAESQCSGIEQAACSAKSECLWVNSYMRKDGRSVAGHCKTRPTKKSVSQHESQSVQLSKVK